MCQPSPSRRIQVASVVVLFAPFLAPSPGAAQAQADVVVIVDTSTRMRDPGMDPQRASQLVAELLTDIVPGELAVIRLLDIVDDKDVLPAGRPGRRRRARRTRAASATSSSRPPTGRPTPATRGAVDLDREYALYEATAARHAALSAHRPRTKAIGT